MPDIISKSGNKTTKITNKKIGSNILFPENQCFSISEYRFSMAVSFRTSVFSLVRFRNSAKFANHSFCKERFFTRLSVIQKRTGKILSVFVWSRRRDSNPRPLGPEPSALPNCATPRFSYAILAQLLYFCNFFLHLL